jgi:release factor glutamine methyltransferase
MDTVQALLRSARDLPGDSAVRDAEILLAHCLGKSRTWLYTWPDAAVSEVCAGQFRGLVQRRIMGEPVAYLTGHREFWSLDLAVTTSTLIPRPETETLVEWALELLLPERADVVDLGTGTGAIALALATERPAWRVTGVDRSDAALAVARDNVRRCGLNNVNVARSDWFIALAGQRFDLVVSNPPYIEEDDEHLAQGDVRFEPRMALVAGKAGLDDIRGIVDQAPDFLRPGGWLLLEHGYRQGVDVRALLQQRGFAAVATRQDLAGQDRISGGLWRAD